MKRRQTRAIAKATRAAKQARAGDVPTSRSADPTAQGNGQTNGLAEQLQRELHQATDPLRRGIESALVVAAPGSVSATDLARQLKIENTLAWRIWRMAHARSGEEAALFAVGPAALDTFLAAAKRSGVDVALLDAVRTAHRALREFIVLRAGDDATFRMMLKSLDDDRHGAPLAESQILFDASRLRIGVQAASQLGTCVLFPSELKGVSSTAVVKAFFDLWWLRPNGHAVLQITRTFHEIQQKRGQPIVHLETPLDARLAKAQGNSTTCSELPLMSDFCCGKSSAVHTEQMGGSNVYSIRPAAVGRDNACTLCFGRVLHHYILPFSQDPYTGFTSWAMVPSESIILEAYVERSLVERGYVFRPVVTDALFMPPEGGLWGPRSNLEALGGTFVTIEPTPTIDNPAKLKRYRELIEYTFNSIGFDRANFYCFRIRVPMPPLGMTLTLAAGEIPGRTP
jgi:hypothetical protein